MSNKEIMDEILKKVENIPIEELEKFVYENYKNCDPETCNGECQGMGGCEVATKFFEKTFGKRNSLFE